MNNFTNIVYKFNAASNQSRYIYFSTKKVKFEKIIKRKSILHQEKLIYCYLKQLHNFYQVILFD